MKKILVSTALFLVCSVTAHADDDQILSACEEANEARDDVKVDCTCVVDTANADPDLKAAIEDAIANSAPLSKEEEAKLADCVE